MREPAARVSGPARRGTICGAALALRRAGREAERNSTKLTTPLPLHNPFTIQVELLRGKLLDAREQSGLHESASLAEREQLSAELENIQVMGLEGAAATKLCRFRVH